MPSAIPEFQHSLQQPRVCVWNAGMEQLRDARGREGGESRGSLFNTPECSVNAWVQSSPSESSVQQKTRALPTELCGAWHWHS